MPFQHGWLGWSNAGTWNRRGADQGPEHADLARAVAEAARRHPLIDPKHYIAALWDPLDGDIDPSGVVYAYAKAARVHGGKYYTHTPVLATRQRADGSWDVETPQGTINAEIVVNAAGLYADEVWQRPDPAHHFELLETLPQRAYSDAAAHGDDYPERITFLLGYLVGNRFEPLDG